MKLASLIARRGDKYESLGCGSDVGALAEKIDQIITAGGVVGGKGDKSVKYDEIVLLTSTGIKKRKRL